MNFKKKVQEIYRCRNAAELYSLADEIPSVEHPRLSLFQDLTISGEATDDFFGQKLATVQITKGCSHRCGFCAAGPAAKIETMPYVAVLKINEQKKEQDRKCTESWEDCA